ncbi:F-box-like domain superfamily [Sesbania bispinosa]|nr:F-box-like domain superfamily [Sesbania bispinosa]
MSMVLRKVWEMVSGCNNPSGEVVRADLGALEQLPSDILMQILKLLGPKEAAKLSLVCKALRFQVSDNRLWLHFLQTHQAEPSWDSVFFAETTLTSGYPLPSFVGQRLHLSFKHIYGQRAQVPGAIIIDGGSGYCKFGWSKYSCPSGRSATFLVMILVGTSTNRVYAWMQVKPNKQPVIVSIPICHYDDTESAKASRRQLKEAIYASLFDMNVPAVCAVNQATLALYAAKRTSGIAVNIGFQVTSVVPILNGKVMRKVGVEVVGLGALKLTGFLKEKMQLNNINFQSLYTVRTLKEESLCLTPIVVLFHLQNSFPKEHNWTITRKLRLMSNKPRLLEKAAAVDCSGFDCSISGTWINAPDQIDSGADCGPNSEAGRGIRPVLTVHLVLSFHLLESKCSQDCLSLNLPFSIYFKLELSLSSCFSHLSSRIANILAWFCFYTWLGNKVMFLNSRFGANIGLIFCYLLGLWTSCEVTAQHVVAGPGEKVSKLEWRPVDYLKLCYVALDYEAELSKDTQASYEAIGEGWFTLSKERFQTGEILFQPHLAGVQAMGLHQAIALCMEHCHSADLPGDNDWYKTVVLSGGTACLPGLAERLEKELHASLPPYMSNGIRVIPPPYGADTPWFGAKIIGNLSTFPGPWCVEKKQFRQKPRLSLIW